MLREEDPERATEVVAPLRPGKDGRTLRITSIGRSGFAQFGLHDSIGVQ
jgi:hypothetical protein